ncbi:MAG: hypothetical protein HYR96_00655, partial [Deltaproteobacteria bacterium]|nr:hypothetical protein [Deltaproteobacteria bacterium]
MQLRIALIATFLLPLVGCISAKSRIHTQLEIDRIQLLNEGIEKEEARKRSLRLALEKIRRKEISPRHVPPTVKLHPPAAAKPDETETVADSSDEWMSHYYSGLSQVSAQAYENAVAEFQRFLDGDPTHVSA